MWLAGVRHWWIYLQFCFFFFFCDPASSLLLVDVAIGDEVEIYEVVGGKDEELRSRGENDRSCGIEVGVVVCRLGRGK